MSVESRSIPNIYHDYQQNSASNLFLKPVMVKGLVCPIPSLLVR